MRDLDEAVGRYNRVLGVGGWMKLRWESDVRWRGELVPSGGVAAVAPFGPIKLELAQPTVSGFLMSDWLDHKGEGVFHFGYRVPDLGETLERVEAHGWGIDLLCVGEEGPEYAYLDPQPTGGVHVELVATRLSGQ